MTTEALVLERGYLGAHRRLILARAVAASIVGVIPVPVLDDWLVRAVLGGAYRRVAAAHQVDVDEDAVTALVHGKTTPPSLADLAGGAIVSRLVTRGWKKLLLAVTAINRARATARTFLAVTLFDHYCARRHTGLGLDRERALAVRDVIIEALDRTPGTLSFEPFRRGALAAARATIKAPLELADLASAGALRRLLARTSSSEVAEPEAVDEVDAALEAQLNAKNGVLSRTVTAIELQLSAEVNPYLDRLIETFDELWRKRENS
jgi:hypothetical protein